MQNSVMRIIFFYFFYFVYFILLCRTLTLKVTIVHKNTNIQNNFKKRNYVHVIHFQR